MYNRRAIFSQRPNHNICSLMQTWELEEQSD